MKRVSAEIFESVRLRGATAFDARPASTSKRDPIPNLPPLPPEDVQAGCLPDLPKDEPVYLICDRGLYSELVGLYLEAAGFREIYNVVGGLLAWRTYRHLRGSMPGRVDCR